jgi:hypothetical protein
MKLLKCEVCGSNELTKNGELFVCDYCGAKYTVETVQNIINQGKIDISGSTVRIDNSGRLRGIVQKALDCYDDGKTDIAMKYVDNALLEDPTLTDALYLKILLTPDNDRHQKERLMERAVENEANNLGLMTKEDFEWLNNLKDCSFINYTITEIDLYIDGDLIKERMKNGGKITVSMDPGDHEVEICDSTTRKTLDKQTVDFTKQPNVKIDTDRNRMPRLFIL